MKWFLKKMSTLIITLLFVSIVTFTAFQIIPGDSAITSLGTTATKESIEKAKEEMGLNDSLPKRYVNWFTKAVKGDFGTSSQYQMPAAELIKERLPVTLWLAFLSFLLIIVCSIPLGLLSASQNGKWIDFFIRLFSQLSMAIPPFFLGILISLIFGLILKLFTPGGYISPSENFTGFLGYLIFPAIAIAIPKIGMVIKYLRTSINRQVRLDYVRTAKSKGMLKGRVLYRHVLKNAFIPVITFLGMIAADVLAGSIIIEQVFSLPGLGRLLVVAISNRDLAVVQGIVLYIAAIVIVINFLVDVIYQYIDPRVRI